MTNPSDAQTAWQQRHAQMRQNAGDWVLKHRNALFLCSQVLTEKWYSTAEEQHDSKNHSCELYCFLSEIEDAVDLLGDLSRELRQANFWPEPETVEAESTETKS